MASQLVLALAEWKEGTLFKFPYMMKTLCQILSVNFGAKVDVEQLAAMKGDGPEDQASRLTQDQINLLGAANTDEWTKGDAGMKRDRGDGGEGSDGMSVSARSGNTIPTTTSNEVHDTGARGSDDGWNVCNGIASVGYASGGRAGGRSRGRGRGTR